MLQEPIITIRSDRYVVPVKQEHRSSFPGIVHDQSGSGATLFIEPMGVVETNNELRRHQLAEEKEIERILAALTAQVDSVGAEIGSTLSGMAALDLIFAKGAFSLALRGVCPTAAEDGILRITGGRHPLIPPKDVVPISLELGRTFDALIITGPNTGGKTVTLKTAGLFVLMAQSGLHVPAGCGTEMGIFHQVYADIGDEQSIEQSLSTFSSHMTNIVDILQHARRGDLVLFDELGAGTDPTEGAALAMAILDSLHGQGIAVMATTHYSELKLYALSKAGVENASVEFDVETLRPTYRLMLGIPGKSNAFEISRRLGLKEALVDGAKAYLSQEDIRFEDIMGNIARDRSLAETEREQAAQARQEMDRLRAQLKREQAELESKKAAQLSKAKEDARRLVREARDTAEEIIHKLRQLGKEADEKARNKAIEEARKKLRTALGGLEEGLHPRGSGEKGYAPAGTLRLGQTVYITTLDQKGQVLSLPDGNGEAQVQVGILKMTVSKDHLRQISDAPESPGQSSRRITPRTVSVTSELDLRGENAEEALLRTDHYLDEAFLAGLNEVTLIHGKGTGVLRSVIHQQLRQHPHVASFRLGRYGEGEAGVTVVQLK
jgi:DNA mismatch repair protein MutS2